MPPIDVYRIGELHFVKDGHHRVSVARALGHKDINAYVTEVLTEVGAEREITLADLPLKSHERLFRERVPLPEPARGAIQLSDEWRYAALAEAVEAWGFRREQATESRCRAPRWRRPGSARSTSRWWRCSGGRARTQGHRTEAYMRVAHLRYLILRTHDWDDSVIERLREELRASHLGRGHDGEGAAEGASLMPSGRTRPSRVLPLMPSGAPGPAGCFRTSRPARRRRRPWRRVRRFRR